MFPTLSLFASVRCPELSASNPGGPCKRSPCLFSHTVAPQARTFPVNKRPVAATNSAEGPASTSRSSEDTDKPAKKAKLAVSSGNKGLFANDEDVTVKAEDGRTEPKKTAGEASVSMAPQTAPLRGTASLRKPTFTIGRDGKVVRKGPPPVARAAQPFPTSTPTSSLIKGKERAIQQDQSASSGATYSAASIGPPRLPLNTKNSYFPIATRNAMLKNIFQEFMTLYAGIQPRAKGQKLAGEHALKQEAVIYNKNNKVCLYSVSLKRKVLP